MNDIHLRAQDAADFLGIHRNTLRRISSRDLPYWRLGTRGDRRYDADDLARYIEERTRR